MRAAGMILAAICAVACSRGEARLVPERAVVGDAIPAALTDVAGDAARGAELFAARDGGHCVLCHAVPDLDAEFQGNVGPAFDGIGARLSAGQLRLRIVDASAVFPDTVMPPYYRIHDLHQVGEAYRGEPALKAQDIEDLIAYLETLT